MAWAMDKPELVGCGKIDNTAGNLAASSLCKNVDHILCTNVVKEERRNCDENDQTIVHKNMSAEEIYLFAKSCFKSSFTSFKNFFTEFIPDLVKGIWNALRGAAELTAKSISSNQKDIGWWQKTKGLYESTLSISADIYETAKQNPGYFFANIWDKITNAVSSSITSFNCLKPEVKIEKTCGFIAEWIFPPALFAKLIVRGANFVKTTKVARKTANDLKSSEEAIKLTKVKNIEDGASPILIQGKAYPMLQGHTYDRLFYGNNGIHFNPDEVFKKGLESRGNNWDLLDHAENRGTKYSIYNKENKIGETAFRGSTEVALSIDGTAGAALWAGEGGYIAEIGNVRGWNVNITLEGRVENAGSGFRGNILGGEQEIAIAARVPPENICSMIPVVLNRLGQLRPDFSKKILNPYRNKEFCPQ